jgi:hypothetical protein
MVFHNAVFPLTQRFCDNLLETQFDVVKATEKEDNAATFG